MPRHWIAQSKKVGFPENEMQAIMNELATQLDSIIDNVSTRLPKSFPMHISTSIFAGMQKAARRL